MLACNDLVVAHGDIVALHGVTLRVEASETVALIGANGAGKTTLLHTISGLNPIASGDIVFEGASLAKLSTDQRVARGIAQAPEGRRIFPGLTVEENLTLATVNWRRFRQSIAADLDRVFELFPRLKERRRQLGWSLSGGEQQMLAIGRALMARPRLLLLDEPSLGLAPRLAEEMYERVGLIAKAGLTILVVEQNTVLALAVADRAYVLEAGRVVLEGAADELKNNARVREAYLGRGMSAEENPMYPDANSQSHALYQRALASLPGGNTRTTVFMKPYPIYAARGEGCRVWDVDGNAFIDCINNFTSLIHGHAHPVLIEAATRQLALGSAFGLPTESEIDLAELLASRLPSVDQVRFANSGSEAVMMALKAARAFTGRPKIAKCEGAYHGSYDYAEVSLDPTPEAWGRNAPVSVAYAKGTPANVLADVVTIPFNDAEAAVSLIREHGSELACVLVDPMPNRAGLAPADQAYLEALRAVTREVGALLIFDEVITFRLGYHGAQGIWGIDPDLTTLGKIIGGGFPVGAIAGHREFMAVFDPRPGKPALPHGGTFSANPVTMRAGLAAMQLLDAAAFARLDAIGQAVRDGIDRAFRDHGVPGGTVGLGSLLKVHFTERKVRDYRSAYMTAEETSRQAVFNTGLLNRGVLAAGYGLMALSLPMTDADVDAIIAAASGALADVAAAA